MNKVEFENNFQKRVMLVSFPKETVISTPSDVRALRSQWTLALGSWHSPYKAIVDCSNLEIGDGNDIKEELDRFLTYLKGFFLKKIVGYPENPPKIHYLPFSLTSEAEARKSVGLDKQGQKRAGSDFRSQITIQNDFRNHVVEVAFSELSSAKTKDDINALKSKLTNNLMQWHTSWNLLIDCTELIVEESTFEECEKMLKIFKSFFMKGVLGYNPQSASAKYPFKVYRSRHNAVARLKGEGMLAGDKADCKSKKST